MSVTIQFYHLTATPVERALPKLAEKAYQAGHRILLVESSEERLEQFNQALWTYHPGAFLPHGSVKEGNAEAQPILLATTPDNRNNADLFLTTDGAMPQNVTEYKRIIDIFDGNDSAAVEEARKRWAGYQKMGHSPVYMRQSDTGAWQEKAVA